MGKFKMAKAGDLIVAPSILSADFANLASEVEDVAQAGAKWVHLDVMDGHFVPNLTMGPAIVKNLRKHFADLFFDAHLMITDPDKYIVPFCQAGTDHITFHIEANGDPGEIIKRLHGMGCSAGLCINPDTPARAIEEYANLCQMILVMTVHPGFGGQSFIEPAAEKIKDLKKFLNPDIRIEVDGGIGPDTAGKVIGYGADTLVAGSAIFGEKDRKKAIDGILNAV